MGGDAFAGAGKAEAFFGRRLDADVSDIGAQRIGNIPAHLRDIRRKLWPLGDDGRVEIAEAVSGLCQSPADLAQQLHAVRAEIAVVVIREKLADVAHGRRAEQRVHDGMDKHIRVGMTVQSLFIRDRHAAENQCAAGNQPVNVIAMADSHTPALLRRINAASSRSSGVVIFRFSSSPSVSCTGMPSASTALQSSVIAISCSFAF